MRSAAPFALAMCGLPLLALGAGCERRVSPPIGPVDEARDTQVVVDDRASLPRVRTREDLAANDGRRVALEGFYDVQRIRWGKGGEIVTVRLVDGTEVIRATSVVRDELGWVERKVLAIGVVHAGPPPGPAQAILAPHVAPERIEAADGLPSPAAPPAEIPAPPFFSSSAPLAARVDRWAQIGGTLEAIVPHGADPGARDAHVRLGDGALLRVERVHEPDWASHLGRTVTVIGRLKLDKPKAGGAFALDLVIRGPSAVCAGTVSRCGMR